MTAKPVDNLVSTVEAAKMIGVTPQTIRNWIHGDVLTAYRVGLRYYRIDPEDLPKAVKVIQAGSVR